MTLNIGVRMKKILTIGLLLPSCLVIILLLWSYHFWPFTTGTNTPAFLGTTFEMSLSEVQRTLKKSGIQLVNFDTFKKIEPELSKATFFFNQLEAVPISPEDKLANSNNEFWYMPSIEMFKSQIVAEFLFSEHKLMVIELRIFPFWNVNAVQVTESIINELKKKYKFIQNEPSKEVPGAYSVKLNGNTSNIEFWINLNDPKNPIMTLYIIYNKASTKQREVRIKSREMSAF
jgi:hypothetical protein